MAGLWKRYLGLLDKFPLVTMASTTGTLMMAGDGISQLAIERIPIKEYDYKRGGRFAIVGFCFFGPGMRFWYLALDKFYKGAKMSALKMVVTDQVIMAPTFLCSFISIMGVLKGDSSSEVKERLKRDFAPVLMTNYKIWPLVQFINFYFLPLQHRVLFVNFVALGWNTYLAWATEKK